LISHETFQKLFYHVNEAVIVIDKTKMVWTNSHVEELFGRTADEVAGTSFLDFIAPESVPDAIAALETVHKTGEYVDAVVRVLAKNGESISVKGRVSQLLGVEEGLYVIFVRAIQPFDNNPRVLFFENEVRHEIFTPIAVIRGYIELLLVMDSSNEQKGYLETVLNNVDRLETKFTDYWENRSSGS
jgi:PAS domain S-box-containing protein